MKKYKNIAIIDIGKTNIKVVDYDVSNHTTLQLYSQVNTVIKNWQYDHLDIEAAWQFILQSLRQINQQHKIEAISITTHGATAALISGDDLILPIIDYEFEYDKALEKSYDKIRGGFYETYSPSLPAGLNLAKQLYFLKTNHPIKFSKVTDILMYPQFWAWKLSGVKRSEVTSFGVHTDLWNLHDNDFSGLVKDLGLAHLFPKFARADDCIGIMQQNVKLAINATQNIDILCGIHDSNASLIPYLSDVDDPKTIISSGTWTIIMNLAGDVTKLDEKRDSLANVSYLGKPVPTARFMGGREFSLLTKDGYSTPDINDVRKIIDLKFYILPTFIENTGPFPSSNSTFIGDVSKLTKAQYSAAICLYLALQTKHSATLTGEASSFMVEGALTKNHIYGGLLAQLSKKPVYFSTDTTGTTFGAALLASPNRITQTAFITINSFKLDGLETYAKQWLDLINDNVKTIA